MSSPAAASINQSAKPEQEASHVGLLEYESEDMGHESRWNKIVYNT